jgi:hypothetical protein
MPIEADRRYAADTTAATSTKGVLMEHPPVWEIKFVFKP